MRSAIVIGGGIGGLSAALRLRRAGLEVAVFEQSRQLSEVNTGLCSARPARCPRAERAKAPPVVLYENRLGAGHASPPGLEAAVAFAGATGAEREARVAGQAST